MYIQNENSLKWEKKIEKLDKSTYNLLREDIKNVIFYSNTLYGSSYLLSKNTSDIYSILKYKDEITWSYGTSNLQYVTNSQTSSVYNDPTDSNYTKYVTNNGFTLKNLFTPDKIIKQTTDKHVVADVATTEQIDLNIVNTGLKIDNYALLNNSILLVKNQITYTVSTYSTDYNIYFDSTTSQYYYYNNLNGLYIFQDGVLTLSQSLTDDIFVYVKEGLNNKEKTFSLKENSAGYISENNSFEFEEVKLNVIKTKLQYQNILENSYYDIYYDAGVSGTVSTFIPERKLYVGDYGVILLEQEGVIRILKNIYKLNLRAIDYNNNSYFVVGQEGTLLKIDRVTLHITKIELGERINFNHIKFYNNYGIIGCDNSTFFYTVDSGSTWIKKVIDEFEYLKINHVYFLEKVAYLSCTQGKILIVDISTLNNSTIVISELNLLMTKKVNDDYVLKNNNNYIESFTFSTQYFKFNENTNFDLPRTIGDGDFTIDFNIRIPSTTISNDIKKYILSLNYEYSVGDFADADEFTLFQSGFEVSHINGIVYFNVGDLSSSTNQISSIDTIQDGLFHNILITRKSNVVKIYLDGILKQTKSTNFYGSLSCNGLGTTMRVGGKNLLEKDGSNPLDTSSSSLLEGNLSNLRFFDKGLSEHEVVKYFNYYDNIDIIISYYEFHDVEDLGIDVYNKKDLTDIYNLGGYLIELVENNYLLILNDDFIVIYDYVNKRSYFLNVQGAINGFVYKQTGITYIYFNTGIAVYNIVLDDININGFNKINFIDNIEVKTTIESTTFNNIKNLLSKIYLLGKEGVVTNSDVSELCETQPPVFTVLPLADVFLDKIKFGISDNDTLYLKDNFDEVYYLYSDTNTYMLEFDFVKENTQVEIDAKDSSDDALSEETAYNVEIEIYNLINGWIEVSLDGVVYTTLKTEGYHKMVLVCGSASKLYINPVLDPSTTDMDRIYCSIKNIRISKEYVYDYTYTTFGTTSFYGEPKCEVFTYSIMDTTTKKLYFPQFIRPNSFTSLSSYRGLSHSWIKVDSLIIGSSSNLIVRPPNATATIYPIIYRGGSTNKGVTCSLGVCTFSVSNPNAYNRFFDNLGYTMSGTNKFTYSVASYSNGLIENTLVNMDISSISYTTSTMLSRTIYSPISMTIDTTKYFSLTARSIELSSSDLANISYVIGVTASDINTVIAPNYINFDGSTTTISSPTTYTNTFNFFSYTSGGTQTFDFYCRLGGSPLVAGETYYVELAFLPAFGGFMGNYDVGFRLANGATTSFHVDNTNFTLYQTAEYNKKFTMVCGTASPTIVSGVPYTKLSVKPNGGTPAFFQIANLIISPKTYDTHTITWSPDTCSLSYLINSSDFSNYAFIQADNTQFEPNCIDCGSSACTNDEIFATNSILSSGTFSNLYNSKMLFLDYDAASKLTFFDKNLEYRMPSDITYNTFGVTYSTIILDSKTGEYNWLSYNKDVLKTFTYLSPKSDSSKVQYSTNFNLIEAPNVDIISFNGSQVSNSKVDVSGVFPNFFTASNVTISNIVHPTSSYKVFFYKNMLAIQTPYEFSAAIGEVLEFTSEVLDKPEKLIINLIYAGTSSKLIYMNHQFTDTIVNDLKESVNSFSFENLNAFLTSDAFYNKFNRHLVNVGYYISKEGNNATLINKFNNYTSYYNLASKLDLYVGATVSNYTSSYKDSFLLFGYKPTYNILDYMTNIKDEAGAPIFSGSDEFNAMIKAEKIPSNLIDFSDNKIVFDTTLKYIWDGLWENTFIDVVLLNNSNFETSRNTRLFVLKKSTSIINSITYYVIECERKIFTDNTFTKVNILSRNTLSQISGDLQDLNNIQRISSNKANDTTVSNPYLDKNIYTNLKSRLNINFNTDNYSKILLSNGKVKQYITAIVYTDYKNELAIDIVNTYNNYELYPVNIAATASNTKSIVTFSNKHTLYANDLFLFNIDNYEYFDGYVKAETIIDEYKLIINRTPITTGTVSGLGFKYIFDPYLNYIPSDIFELGFDKKTKKAIRIDYSQFEEKNDETVSLKNIDYTKYKYNLIDNLDIISLSKNFRWFLEAEVDNATIGQDENGLIWYEGDWLYGRFFGSKWYSGNWYNGEWYTGDMYSYQVDKTALGAKVNTSISTLNNTVWYNGNFRGGSLNTATWLNGNFYAGNINNSVWYNGKFHNGGWKDSSFLGGQFISGVFNGGTFSSDYVDAFWLDGVFDKGIFKSGTWYNGTFTTIDATNPSIFGKGSTNTLKATWKNGSFINGIFTASDYRFSVWEAGKWSNSVFENGYSKNITFNGGKWINGVSDFIKVYALNLSGIEQFIVVEGNLNLNIGYEMNILISDYNSFVLYVRDYVIYDSVNNVSIIKVVNTAENIVTGFVNDAAPSITTYTTTFSENILNYKLVSTFNRAEWVNGTWVNGMFNGTSFKGGTWIDGIFEEGEFG